MKGRDRIMATIERRIDAQNAARREEHLSGETQGLSGEQSCQNR